MRPSVIWQFRAAFPLNSGLQNLFVPACRTRKGRNFYLRTIAREGDSGCGERIKGVLVNLAFPTCRRPDVISLYSEASAAADHGTRAGQSDARPAYDFADSAILSDGGN